MIERMQVRHFPRECFGSNFERMQDMCGQGGVDVEVCGIETYSEDGNINVDCITPP